MYKCILIPTDGSTLSRKAVRAGLQLAKALRACVVGVHVRTRFTYIDPPEFGTGAEIDKLRASAEKKQDRVLAGFERAAKAAQVRCSTERLRGDPLWRAVLEAAGKHQCDLIVIASHGRGALHGLVRGSETASLLSRSRIPVLVLR